MATELPAPAPDQTPETADFWAATAGGRLLLKRCERCAAVGWYPRALCASCGSVELSGIAASGHGTVYSFTVVHRSLGSYRDAAPYVIAYVELDEGPRVLTNIVGCEPELIHIGQSVTLEFHDTGEGSALYRFKPDGS